MVRSAGQARLLKTASSSAGLSGCFTGLIHSRTPTSGAELFRYSTSGAGRFWFWQSGQVKERERAVVESTEARFLKGGKCRKACFRPDRSLESLLSGRRLLAVEDE